MIRQVFEEFNAPRRGTVYSDPTTDDLYGLFRRQGSILYVAEYRGRVLGCCGVFPTEGLPVGIAELVKYYLPPEARGKGIGKALLARNIEEAREMGYSALYLESLPQFSTALGIYERLGFTNLESPLGASGHSGCSIWMIREL